MAATQINEQTLSFLPRLLVTLLAYLLEAAELLVDTVQRAAGGSQGLAGLHALLQNFLPLHFQIVDRAVALGQLARQLAQAQIQLTALAAHPFQRLAQ